MEVVSETAAEYVVKDPDTEEMKTVYNYNSEFGCDPKERVVKAAYTERLPSDLKQLRQEAEFGLQYPYNDGIIESCDYILDARFA